VQHDDLGRVSVLLDRLGADTSGLRALAKVRRAFEPLRRAKREWVIGRDSMKKVKLRARSSSQRECALEGRVPAVLKTQCDENSICVSFDLLSFRESKSQAHERTS
jgi:hypothetical protein